MPSAAHPTTPQASAARPARPDSHPRELPPHDHAAADVRRSIGGSPYLWPHVPPLRDGARAKRLRWPEGLRRPGTLGPLPQAAPEHGPEALTSARSAAPSAGIHTPGATAHTTAAAALALALCLTLAACGGSDEPLPDERKYTGPVDCLATPQRCV